MFSLPEEILLNNKHRNLPRGLHLTSWPHVSGYLPMAMNHCITVILKLYCTLKSPGELLKTPVPRLHLSQLNQYIWWVWVNHQFFFLMIPQRITMSNKVWKPLFHCTSDSCGFPVDKLSEWRIRREFLICESSSLFGLPNS